MAADSRFLQAALRTAPGAMLIACAAVGGLWAATHRGPANSALDGGPLATLGRPSVSTVLDGTWMRDADAFMDQRLPSRQRMLEAHAAIVSTGLRSPVLNAVYLRGPDGQLLEKPPNLKIRDTLASEASTLDDTAGDVPILWLYMPRKEELYAQSVPAAWPNDYPEANSAILGAWSGHGDVVDLTSLVGAHVPGGDAYIRTDHHWTPSVAKEAADAAASELAAIGVPVGADERQYSDVTGPFPFFGSTGRVVTAGATDPDPFIYPTPTGGFQATMCLEQECGLPTLDEGKINNPARYANRYAAFIGGDNGYVSITNDSPSAKGTVLLLKDSFGDAFATYLAERVARLDVIDERHYDGQPLDTVISELKPDAVIVLHNSLSLLAPTFNASVWESHADVPTVEPQVVGNVVIANEQGLLLQLGVNQKVDDQLTADASSLVRAIDDTGTPQLWFMAPRKEVVFADLMPPGVDNPIPASSAAVLKALRAAVPVEDLTAPLSAAADRDRFWLRTDHHWTPDGANVAVESILAGLADKGVAIGDDDREWHPSVGPLPFYGSEARALPEGEPVIPDDLVYETPEGGFRATLCTSDTACGLSPIDRSFLTGPKLELNRYRAFMGGTTGLMHLHNEDPAAKGTLVLFSDSYGTPAAIRLGERTRDLYFIDERKWTGGPVGRFVDEVDADAVVVLHNPVTVLAKVFNRDVWRDAGD